MNQLLAIAHMMPWSGMGGVEIATLRLVAATRDRYRHIGFCLPDAGQLRQAFTALGIETRTFQAATPSLRHGLRFYRESLRIADELRAVRADIVHFAEVKAAQDNSLAAVLAGCRLICHVRVSHPHLDFRQRLALAPVNLFLFVSDEARRSFALPLPGRKVRVLYDAVELPALSVPVHNEAVRGEFGIASQTPVIGMVARVSPQKDYFTLADAAVLVLKQHPSARFFIVGDNSLVDLNREHYAKVVGRLEELGIADSFTFTGHRTDVSRLTCAMDLCVLCTHREGFPLSILETMALRKAMVATDVGGIAEIVHPGSTGYLHAHEDSRQLAQAIISLIDNPEEARRLGEAGYDHVRSHHSPELYVRTLSSLYDAAASPRTRP